MAMFEKKFRDSSELAQITERIARMTERAIVRAEKEGADVRAIMNRLAENIIEAMTVEARTDENLPVSEPGGWG